ncbi:unnamed protein product, partial [Porites evermanni]
RPCVDNCRIDIKVLGTLNHFFFFILSTLSLFQVKYLQLMYLLSTKAVNLISEYVDNFPRKENTNLEPDNAHDDDSNDDDDDDNNNDDDDDKDNNDIDDDADNDENGDDDNNGNGDADNDDDY